ncbi:MAG: hypothetical protein QXI12_00895, partial [Candidatus Methanomethyliaceae archaeon]
FEFKKPVSPLLVGFSNPISGSYSQVRWKPKFLSGLSINHVVEGNWIENSPFKRYLGNMVAGISKSLKGCKQFLRFFNARLKFAYNGFREIHQKAYMQFRYLNFKLLTSIPHTTEVRGFP